MSLPTFSSWLGSRFRQFLELKRASGFDYANQPVMLARLDRFLAARKARRPLTASVLRDYIATLSHLFPRTRDLHVSVIWQALGYARDRGAPIEALPDRPRSTRSSTRMREPFVLSFSQVDRLLAATRALTTLPYVQATHACFLGLLYTTGLRAGEALSLNVGDFDRREGALLVRAGKFGKGRLLPLHESTTLALTRYLEEPVRPPVRDSDEPFFVSRQRGRLSYTAAREMLLRAARLAGVEDETDYRLRPHDLRYTFAVHRIAAWYRDGRDVNTLLPALSTYMGHVSPAHTYTYLRGAELLLGEINRRFEASADAALDGGRR